MTLDLVFTIGPWLLLLGVLLTKLSGRLNVPALIFFIVLGMLAGSEGVGGIHFENYALTKDVGFVALALILFAGGLETSPRTFALALRSAASLATLGVLLTAVVTASFAVWLLKVSWLEGVLLGSLVASTDAAAVFSILRHQNAKLVKRVESILEVESGINDPMSVFMTLTVTQLLLAGGAGSPGAILVDFVVQMGLGLLIGVGLGMVGGWALDRIKLDVAGLYPVMTLGLGLGTFTLTSQLGGSGFLAVYLTGLMIGRHLTVARRLIVGFHDGLAWLMQIVMFVVLGLLSFPSDVLAVANQGLILSAVVMVIARPAAVFLSLLFARVSVRERLLISWVGLRGAVPIILATLPLLAGLPNGGLFFNIIFFVVVTSVLLQGTTVSWAANKLGLQRRWYPEPAHRLHISSLQRTDRYIVDYYLDATSPSVGRMIRELSLPPETFIAMIVRGEQVLPPQGQTRLAARDHLFVLCRVRDQPELERLFDAGLESAAVSARPGQEQSG